MTIRERSSVFALARVDVVRVASQACAWKQLEKYQDGLGRLATALPSREPR
jgi:hypothetical protein